ncbi:MAG: putative glycolipid-binding domain-containing protein [Ilumatobacteraceae bacterium]
MANYAAPSSAGLRVGWTRWDTTHTSDVVLRWENEGWTAEGRIHIHKAQFVIRLSAQWRVQQFLLFRDMSEPDLWLATDGGGRWGEINGAHRTELDGCVDIDLAGTPFTNVIPIRRLPLGVGQAASLNVIAVDVETLGVTVIPQIYSRLGTHSWRYTSLAQGTDVEVEVDEFGFITDEPGAFRRITNQ